MNMSIAKWSVVINRKVKPLAYDYKMHDKSSIRFIKMGVDSISPKNRMLASCSKFLSD